MKHQIRGSGVHGTTSLLCRMCRSLQVMETSGFTVTVELRVTCAVTETITACTMLAIHSGSSADYLYVYPGSVGSGDERRLVRAGVREWILCGCLIEGQRPSPAPSLCVTITSSSVTLRHHRQELDNLKLSPFSFVNHNLSANSILMSWLSLECGQTVWISHNSISTSQRFSDYWRCILYIN